MTREPKSDKYIREYFEKAGERSRKARGVVLLETVKVGTTVYAWDGTPLRVEHQSKGSCTTVSRESEREIFGKVVKSRPRTTISHKSEVHLTPPKEAQ